MANKNSNSSSKRLVARGTKPAAGSTYVVYGRVIPVGENFTSGLQVKAFDQDIGREDLLGEAVADQDGNYKITYPESQFRRSKKEVGGPDLVVRVYSPEGKVMAQSKCKRNVNREEVVNLILGGESSLTVSGTITRSDGRPAAGALVRAHDQDLRRKQLLGKATADSEGRYKIVYTAGKFQRAERASADLRLSVVDPKGRELVSSEVLFNAPPEAVIDLTLPPDSQTLSEFEILLEALSPLLAGQGKKGADLNIEELEEKDIDFLARESGQPQERITCLLAAVKAAAASDASSLPPVATHATGPRRSAIPLEVFYGWFRQGQPTTFAELIGRPLDSLRQALLAAIEQNIVPARLGKQIEAILAAIPNPSRDVLARVGSLAGLSQTRTAALLLQVDGIESLTNDNLAGLVEEKVVSAADADKLGLNVTLHRLFNGQEDAVRILKDTPFPSLGDKPPKLARELARLTLEEWQQALSAAGQAPTDETSGRALARSLAMQAAGAFPEDAMRARLTTVSAGLDDQLAAVQPIFEKDPNALAKAFDDLDLEGLSDSRRQALRAPFEQLKQFANQHPGLGMHEVMSAKATPEKKAAAVRQRLGWARKLADLNPGLDLLALDYLPGSPDLESIRFGTLPEAARTAVLEDLKANQRIQLLTGNVVSSVELLQAGYHSASAIALTRVQDFVKDSRLPEEEAYPIHQKATQQANQAALNWFTVFEAVRDEAASQLRVLPSQSQFFKDLRGYVELFHEQPWCECQHCQSVLSPAAYFVDLMYYIELNILQDSFKGRESDALHLKVRRPDLWKLELTCENTHEYLPYLDVINEILEGYIREIKNLPDQDGVYAELAAQDGSFSQPFCLPLEKLDVLLGHFQTSRYKVARAIEAPSETRVRARLGLSQGAYNLVIQDRSATQVSGVRYLNILYQLNANLGAPDQIADPIDIGLILRVTGLSRELLELVLQSSFIKATSPAQKPSIESGVISGSGGVQTNLEWVRDLTPRRLDRMHRFARLWRYLPWTINELDHVLARLEAQNLAVGIDANALARIVALLDLQESTQLPLDELMALWDEIPTVPLGEAPALFDRLFNQQPYVKSANDRWPAGSKRFTHPALRTPPGASDPDNEAIASRLLSALQVDDSTLVALIEGLGEQLDPNDPGKSFLLTTQNLGMLYRHARLARLLEVEPDRLFLILHLNPLLVAQPGLLGSLEGLSDVLVLCNRQKTSGFSFEELAYLTDPQAPAPKSVPDMTGLTGSIVAAVSRDNSLAFSETVFTQIGLTEAQSRRIVQDNLTSDPATPRAFETTSNGAMVRLTAGFDPDAAPGLQFTDPSLDQTARAQARDLVRKYDPLAILFNQLAAFLKITPEKARGLFRLARPATLPADRIEVARAFQRAQDTTPLEAILADILRIAVLLRDASFDADGVEFVAANRNRFALGGPVILDTVWRTAAYARLAARSDPAFTPVSAEPDVRALQGMIDGSATDDASLARALRSDQARIASLRPNLAPLPAEPFAALERLATSLELADLLGVDGEALKRIASDDFAQLGLACDAVLGAFHVRYPDDLTVRQKLEPFEDKLRGRKRDALVDYCVNTLGQVFTSPDKLYEYFLVDVRLEGCARTSRLVAAISSLQLYVHRVLMGLEQSDSVRARFSDSLKAMEWIWRQHYRIWEANRKVFLYPENYLEPGLRDDKTPLFEELEDTLLQQEVSDESVQEAYSKYLEGFDEVSGLKIAGAYRDRDTDHDVLYILGVSPADPPVHYYRTIRNLGTDSESTSAWIKISIQIPAAKVSPIVYMGRLYIFWMEISTQQVSEIKEGSSSFAGYRHTIRLKYTSLRSDGAWSASQTLKIVEQDGSISPSRIVEDPLEEINKPNSAEIEKITATYDPYRRDHRKPLDGYTPDGWEWERPYPSLLPAGTGSEARLLLMLEPKSSGITLPEEVDLDSGSILTRNWLTGTAFIDGFTISRNQNGSIDLQRASIPNNSSLNFYFSTIRLNEEYPHGQPFVSLPAGSLLQVVNGVSLSLVAELGRNALLLAPRNDGLLRFARLRTTLGPQLRHLNSAGGIAGLLATSGQDQLNEIAPSITATPGPVILSLTNNLIDKRNPDISYVREIFCHIPSLIANHLNSQQKFAASQRWYHYIFNPLASDGQVWRYREFKALPAQSLKDMLTDPGALAAYRNDPFNPHAIARMRLSAYQKSIVMKYIDNLLDWGDSLFGQFTMESVNEATMLYVMAQDILGPRPPQLGRCSDVSGSPLTYDNIRPSLDQTSDFLVELEHTTTLVDISLGSTIMAKGHYMIEAAKSAEAAGPGLSNGISSPAEGPTPPPAIPGGGPIPYGGNGTLATYWTGAGGTPMANYYLPPVGQGVGGLTVLGTDKNGPRTPGNIDYFPPLTGSLGGTIGVVGGAQIVPFDQIPPLDVKYGFGDIQFPGGGRSFGHIPPPNVNPIEIVPSRAVFCIPPNNDLLAYWDRVEDRLFKIRNCMDIAGVRRQLELFAPEIDPRLLVRMKAAGLSLEDVLEATRGSIPPYRFSYIIEKARQYAATLQGFGSQLLSAIEKHDAEELNQLRTVHEQNLQKMRSQVMLWEIDAAEEAIQGLNRQKEAIEYRQSHYESLIQTGLNGWEHAQQAAVHLVSVLNGMEATFEFLTGALGLLPSVGAPTAMTYGGREFSKQSGSVARAFKALASASQAVASSTGLEASYQRREEEWKHQLELANRDLTQIDRQIEAARIRKEIAQRSQEVHERSIQQTEEVFDLFRERFSNLGRYTWLSTQLHRLYRMAFNSALSVAQLAERAYRFERPEDAGEPIITDGYWDSENGGLLAGEKLLLDLQQMESRFIETNHRKLEIEQSFSLAQFAPEKLVELRKEGSCTFTVPEVFFDLFYPGHFYRLIKAVRLTIPCVTGPYTNVGAMLRLNGSWVREEPSQVAALRAVPLQRTVHIATSSANRDAGVFEFSFRDERYMPFEGAGAVNSGWQIQLPDQFRAFDYDTISDVILHISYTAEEDVAYRDVIETNNGQILKAILNATSLKRMLSLRHNFPTAWNKLVHSNPGTDVTIELSMDHLPFFIADRSLQAADMDVILQTGLSPTLKLDFDNTEIGTQSNSWGTGTEGLPKGSVSATRFLGNHTLQIVDSGNLGSNDLAIDEAKLEDILLVFTLKL